MKLISLTANQPGFRQINFKETGISIYGAQNEKYILNFIKAL